MIINFLNLRQLNNPVMKKNLQYFSKEVIRRFSVIRISMVSLLIVGSALNALSSIQKVEITFDESDFSYSVDPATHHTYVECSKVNASYPRAGMPSLPLLSKNIVLRVGQEYVSTKVTVSKKAVKNRITLAKCSEDVSTDISINDPGNTSGKEPYAFDYPEKVCLLNGTSAIEGYQMLHYLITPFEYVRNSGTLYFIYKMTLEIETKDLETSSGSPLLTSYNHELVAAIASNTAVINHSPIDIEYEQPIDYLLITCDSLATSFQPLLNWKHVKGLRVAIETVEDINSSYTGEDLPIKIKKCIRDYSNNHGIKYVLLGGDTEIVPTRYCNMGTYKRNEKDPQFNNIPTDKFYACFGNTFNWDRDGDNTYGELEDNVDLIDDVYLTRMPVNNRMDAYNVSMKFVDSERNPIWNENILMAGSSMRQYLHYSIIDPDDKGTSDAEMLGDRLYDEHIKSYFTGKRVRYFDTGTDFDGDENVDLTPDGLRNELCKGYSFIEYIGHGDSNKWIVEKKAEFQSIPHVNNIVSPVNTTVITTNSCRTNYFDFDEACGLGPCLSEAFMRNTESGVVGYFGCSRSGFYNGLIFNGYGTSLRYDASFYDMLFSDRIVDKNFGKIASLAKLQRVGLITSGSNEVDGETLNSDSERWVQYGINPVGDPEMPLFTEQPMQFDNANCTVNIKQGSLSLGLGFVTTIDTGVDGCRVSITSEDDNGSRFFKVYENVRSVTYNGLFDKCIATITKQNYKPKQIYAYLKAADNTGEGGAKILACNPSSGDGEIKLSLHLPEDASDVQILVSDYELGSQNVYSLSKEDLGDLNSVPVNIKKAGIPKTYVVYLVVNGQIYDSINILK